MRLIASLVCLFALSVATYAMPVPPTQVPVARLIQNLTAQISKNPRDPETHFMLGRVHYFAFAAPSRSISVFGYGDNMTKPVPPLYILGQQGKAYQGASPDEKISESERLDHLRSAVSEVNTAIRLAGKDWKPKEGEARTNLHYLTLACIYEEGAPFAAKAKLRPHIRCYAPKTNHH